MTDSPTASPLRIAGAQRLVLDQTSVTAHDPLLRPYLTDMVAPYGLALREDLLVDGAGHSFGELAEPLIAALAPADAAPIDLLILAFAMHDLRPGRSTATYLSHLCPGSPLAFSVCDQGTAAAFSGLRLIQTYAGAGDCRRALLVVAEQSALHYEPAAEVALPQRHAAVAVLFDQVGPTALGPVRQHTGVRPEQAAGVLADELDRLVGDRTEATLILGDGFADPGRLALPSAVDEVVSAPAGQPCTGAWWELAGGLDRWAAQGRLVVVADYDPLLGYLSLGAVAP